MPYRQSLWRTQVSVGPTGREYDLGPADKWAGGGGTSDANSYPRANGSVALGGRKTRDDGTATYLYDEKMHSLYRTLDNGVGMFRAVIVRTPLKDDGSPMLGGGFTMTGGLAGISEPDTDYGSNDGAEVELSFNLDAPLA
jgi:hypothetical protein